MKELGEAVTLNGNSKTRIIVAVRKSTIPQRAFFYDYIAINDFAFFMINVEFSEKMIHENKDVQSIKMPDKYEDYNSIEDIQRAYCSLKESFKSKDKSHEFDFIEEKLFIEIVQKIVSNTFEAE